MYNIMLVLILGSSGMTPCKLVGDHQPRNILHLFWDTVILTVILYVTDGRVPVRRTKKLSRWKIIDILYSRPYLGLVRVSLVFRNERINNSHECYIGCAYMNMSEVI
jgi:hypothetical protein